MNVKNAIKKIVAVGAGLSMIGATVLGANLASYPAPFIEDGKFNGYIVVGASAAAEDVVGAVDVASSLQFAIKEPASAASTVVASVDEGVLIEKSGNDLNLGEGIASIFTKLTDEDLPTILAEGEYDENEGETTNKVDYTQELTFTAGVSELTFAADEDNDDTASDMYFINDNGNVYTYTLDFAGSVDFVDAADLENTKIMMQGNEYTITEVKLDATDTMIDKLTLMAGDTTVWLREGDSITRIMDGEEHTIEVSDVTENEDACGVYVDGSASPTWIDVGDTEEINGVSIGVVNARAVNSQLQDSDVCEINIGADELILEDGEEIKIGGTDLDGSLVAFDNAVANEWATLTVTYESDDEHYLTSGQEWTDPVFGNFKLSYEGLIQDTEAIELDVSAEKAELTFTNADGDEVVIPFTLSEVGDATAGDDAVILGNELDEEYMQYAAGTYDCTLASPGATAAEQIRSCEGTLLYIVDTGNIPHVLEVTSVAADGLTGDIKDLTADKEYEDLDFDGTAISISSLSSTFTLTIADDAGVTDIGKLTLGGLTLAAGLGETEFGANIDFTTAVGDIVVTDDDSDFGDAMTISMVENAATADEIDTTLSITAGTAIASALSPDEDDDDNQLYVTSYGTMAELNTDSEDVEISYPDEPAYGQVFVSPVSASISSSSTGAYTIEKINVGSAKLDTEVANVEAQNVLVVGGPCANGVAREVMGRDMNNCADGFSEGVGMIKFLNNGNNVALVVAGYSAMDTRAATRVLANYADYDLSGSDMEVTYTDLSNIDVRAPMLE